MSDRPLTFADPGRFEIYCHHSPPMDYPEEAHGTVQVCIPQRGAAYSVTRQSEGGSRLVHRLGARDILIIPAGQPHAVTWRRPAEIVSLQLYEPFFDRFPYYGGTWRSLDEIIKGLFGPLRRDWSSFAVNAEHFVTQGDEVVSLGRYVGTYKATGRSMTAPFAHHWTARGGKVTRFVQYTDTAKVLEAVSRRAGGRSARTFSISVSRVKGGSGGRGLRERGSSAPSCAGTQSCAQRGHFRLELGDAPLGIAERSFDVGRVDLLWDMLAAIDGPGFDLEQDDLLGIGMIAAGHEPLRQLLVAADDACPSPDLDPALIGVVRQEQKRLRILGEVSRRDVLPIAGVVDEAQRPVINDTDETLGPAAMLDVGAPHRARRSQIDTVALGEERLEIRRHGRAPAASFLKAAKHSARPPAFLDRLDGRREGDIGRRRDRHGSSFWRAGLDGFRPSSFLATAEIWSLRFRVSAP